MLQQRGNFKVVPFSGIRRRRDVSSLVDQRPILASTQEPVELSRESALVQENIEKQILVVSKGYMDIECENTVLRAGIAELSERLQSLNSIFEMMEGVIGVNLEIPDSLMNPWQLPYSSQPIAASADMFRY